MNDHDATTKMLALVSDQQLKDMYKRLQQHLLIMKTELINRKIPHDSP